MGYEKRVIEILRINNTKRAKKFLRKRLGTQRAALRKRQEMANIMAEQNKKQAAEDAARKEARKAKKLRKRKLKLPPNRIIYNCNISLDASLVFFLLFKNMANFEMLKSVLTHLDGPILLLKLVIFF